MVPQAWAFQGGALHAGAGFLPVFEFGSMVDKLHTQWLLSCSCSRGRLAWHHSLTTILPPVPVPQHELKSLGASKTA